ncbi:ParB/RepB/Spo0J family partition protein [Megamonas funiformis]|jgi:hypothetical protein|uniref:ParB/RepB/Spo0J family partition protein n=4 Tax=Megamonas funiformis TaxID=437897 RepID=UPI0022E0F082|nr:ParB N-terminal domain-containing protein [Megamonas funiformis]
MAIKNINMAKVFSSANTKQSLRLVCDYINADELEVNPENEIIYGKLNIDDLKAEIIRSGGVKNPIEVIKKNDKLIIISGHRRQLATLQAFNEGKLSSKKVPYFINDTIKSLDDEKMAIIGRNTQREKDFKTRFNEITILTEILSKEVQNEKGRFRKNIADRIGISEAELQRYWDYKKFCPEIKEAIQDENSTLTFSKAAELRGLNEEEQHKALEIIKQKNDISTMELRNLKKSIKEGYNANDLAKDYTPKQKETSKNEKDNKLTNQDIEKEKVVTKVQENVDTIKNSEIKNDINNIKNNNEDIEINAIETCLSILNNKKNELDKQLDTINDDEQGLNILAVMDYLNKLIVNCQKDLDIKIERGYIHENDREGDI